MKYLGWICLALMAVACSHHTSEEHVEIIAPEELPQEEPLTRFGFLVDSFDIKEGHIRNNENLSTILAKYGVDYGTIDLLAKESRDVFDVRRLAAGRKYTLLCDKDSSGYAKCFIYEKSPVDYVVFDWRDSLQIYQGAKQVDTVRRTVSGEINSSLYMNMVRNGVDPGLAISLSEIYAWTIDFYRIQKGDQYKIVFDELYVDEKPVGIGQIHGTWFKHSGEDIYAFYFEQDEHGDYFDVEAQGLRKAFLKAPLKFSRISSHYSLRRFHPVQKRYKAHLGTDYAAPTGTPIHSVGDGVITHAAYTSGNGRYVKVRHNGTYTTQYLHMSRIGDGIKPGKYVKQGDVIGYVGSTGLATGPHVCFRFWKNGVQVDPLKEKLPPSEPVRKENMDAFEKVKAQLKKELDAIPVRPEREQTVSL
ncbi:MAG: peptidoglycan DD-metalloendopeptidase family protein [Flavobacteriales bacterium]|nr:peptidoglycan DD-metalloendopeptidase family protein [Flavobacteriales bacterium]